MRVLAEPLWFLAWYCQPLPLRRVEVISTPKLAGWPPPLITTVPAGQLTETLPLAPAAIGVLFETWMIPPSSEARTEPA